MGVELFDTLRAKVGKASQFEQGNFESLPTYENFFYQHEGAYTINQGGGVEIQLTVPGGNYEIEATTRLYNNSDERIIYTCGLDYYLEDNLRQLWEGGYLASTALGKPYIIRFKTMSTFKQQKVIKFNFGTNAVFGGIAAEPQIMVRRIGAIRYTSD